MTKIFGMIFGMPTADREFQFFRPLRGGGRHQVRMVKLFAVCEQIEDENFHGRVSQGMFAILPYGGIRGSGYGRSRRPANTCKKIPHMRNGGFQWGIAGAPLSGWALPSRRNNLFRLPASPHI